MAREQIPKCFIHYYRCVLSVLNTKCFTPLTSFQHSYHQNSCLFLKWHNVNDANKTNYLPEIHRLVSPDIALIIYFEIFTTLLLLFSVMSALTDCHFFDKFIWYFEFREVKYKWIRMKQTNKQRMKNVENWEYILKLMDFKISSSYGSVTWKVSVQSLNEYRTIHVIE